MSLAKDARALLDALQALDSNRRDPSYDAAVSRADVVARVKQAREKLDKTLSTRGIRGS